MKKNMGLGDKIIRVAIAALIAVLYFTKQIDGATATVLGAFGLAFVATSFISFCPLYWALGLSTKKKNKIA